MNRFFTLLLVCLIGLGAAAQSSDKDHYRRSSLCLVLLAHDDKQYAEAMARVFQDFPMPARYNEHNTSVRVIRVKGHQSRSDIERLLRKHDIAKDVVSRWFNRSSYSGMMDMDLIHERGGYGAFHDDYTRAMNTVRGTDLLREEGIELLQSTFVLVCDMDYYNRKKGFKVGAALAKGLSVVGEVASAYNQYSAYQSASQGNYAQARRQAQNAQAYHAGATLMNATGEVLDDLGGFAVKIHSYLFRLRWDEGMTAAMFNRYWVDSSTPRAEAQRRKEAYENARFGLEYIGDYKAKSGKTIFLSCNDEDKVILDVCSRSVDKNIKKLAAKYPVFRPRTPFYFQGHTLYSHIGSKEDVSGDKKYEIVERVCDKKGRIHYKRVGMVKPSQIWNNREVSFDRYFDSHPGSSFEIKKGKMQELASTPGLQIREMK